jgi:hypothetical protein
MANEVEQVQAALKRLGQMRRLNCVEMRDGDESGVPFSSGFLAGFEAAIVLADYLDSMIGLERQQLVGELRAELRDLEGTVNRVRSQPAADDEGVEHAAVSDRPETPRRSARHSHQGAKSVS